MHLGFSIWNPKDRNLCFVALNGNKHYIFFGYEEARNKLIIALLQNLLELARFTSFLS